MPRSYLRPTDSDSPGVRLSYLYFFFPNTIGYYDAQLPPKTFDLLVMKINLEVRQAWV